MLISVMRQPPGGMAGVPPLGELGRDTHRSGPMSPARQTHQVDVIATYFPFPFLLAALR